MSGAAQAVFTMRLRVAASPDGLPLVNVIYGGTEHECRIHGPRHLPPPDGNKHSIGTIEYILTTDNAELLNRLQAKQRDEADPAEDGVGLTD